MCRGTLAVCAVLVLVACAPAHAQDTGAAATRIALTGVVTDTSAAVLPGAVIQVTGGDRSVPVVTTGANGRYRVELGTNTRYQIRVVLDGFTEQHFELHTGSTDLTRDLVLTVGGINEAIVVSATSPQSLASPARTGSRLELSPLQTPASVEIISGELIRTTGDENISAVASRATGIVNTSSAFGFVFSARGFTGPTSVMTLYDGARMYIGGALTFPSEPWMAERIEVLRGPSSVLYGEGAIGAAINVVRKEPARQRQNEVRRLRRFLRHHRPGCWQRWSARPEVVLPHRRGPESFRRWMDRGESRGTAISAALRFDVSDRLKLTLVHDSTDADPRRWFGVPTINGVFNGELRTKNYNVANPALHFQDHWTQLKAEWSPTESVSLNSTVYYLTNYRYYHNAESQVWNAASDRIALGTFLEILNEQWQIGNRTTLRHNRTLGGRPEPFRRRIRRQWRAAHADR